MKYEDLTEEQKGKIAGAKSPEEILEMAKAEGYELILWSLISIA